MSHAHRSHTIRQLGLAVALLITVLLAHRVPAAAQCAGDCNGDGTVAVNELIIAVNIALQLAPATNCSAADRDGDGSIVVSELIQAVNSALNGCNGTGSPTATRTPSSGSPTPTRTQATGSPTPTRPVPPNCGNGRVEPSEGETCDDGNRSEGPGDSCPANCRIESCTPSGETLTAEVVFDTAPADLLVAGMTVFIRYPDGTVEIPGSSNAPPVQDAIMSDFFTITPNDYDYAVQAVLLDPFGFGVEQGTAMTITFTRCRDAGRPAQGAFTCRVVDAADPEFRTVTNQVSCRVVLP